MIDLVARDLDHLLEQLQGRTVETATGDVTLDIVSAPRYRAPMNLVEQLLHVISDPNIAFVLLSVGTIGIIAELYNPGLLFPGITGVISLILAFFALGNLPTNWAGVAFIILAIVLMVAELVVEGTGALGIGATIAFSLAVCSCFAPCPPRRRLCGLAGGSLGVRQCHGAHGYLYLSSYLSGGTGASGANSYWS